MMTGRSVAELLTEAKGCLEVGVSYFDGGNVGMVFIASAIEDLANATLAQSAALDRQAKAMEQLLVRMAEGARQTREGCEKETEQKGGSDEHADL